MDEKVREALEGSIKHWEENAAAQTIDDAHVDMEHCALCCMFYLVNAHCRGCPVHAAGYDTCERSPYKNATEALFEWEEEPHSLRHKAAWQYAAETERQFLISLRPKDSQEK